MENNTGWVKLYRKIFDNPYMNKPAYLSVWIWILSHAEHGKKLDGKKWIDELPEEMPSILWKGERRFLKRGEFTFGAIRISEDTGIPRGTVERIVKTFKNEEQIEVQSSNKFSVGIVKNWDKYQSSEQQNEEQMRNKRGTSEDVTKNDKNVKNDKKYTEANLSLEDVAEKINEAFNVYLGRKFKGIDSFKNNLAYWLDTYQPKEIEEAIRNIKYDKFWRDKMTPTVLFRRKNPQGEPVDYISQLLIKENDGYPR